MFVSLLNFPSLFVVNLYIILAPAKTFHVLLDPVVLSLPRISPLSNSEYLHHQTLLDQLASSLHSTCPTISIPLLVIKLI